MQNRIRAVRWQEMVTPLAAVILALAIGAGFILFVGENPLTAYKILFVDLLAILEMATTLQRATPLMLPDWQ